jgi:four helix bundle protein
LSGREGHNLTLKVIRAAEKIKKSSSSDVIMKQFPGAVTSIGANVAEGYGRHEGKE